MKTKNLVKLLISIIVIGGGVGYFMYQAMQSSWSYYYSVDEFASNSASVQNNSFRLAGKVKPSSINRDMQKVQLNFVLSGTTSELPVQYNGTVPDNFTDDIEVVVEGRLNSEGVFQAETLLTKCESKYEAKVN